MKEVVTDGQTGPRATAIALISSVLNSYWNNRRITGNFWFEQPQNPQGGPPNAHGQKYINHNSSQTAGLADRVAGWQVPYAIVEEELRRQNVRLIFILYFSHRFILLETFTQSRKQKKCADASLWGFIL